MKLAFEYGTGLMPAELPDTTQVFIPGETVPDPPFLTDVSAATRESILNPIGMPPLAQLARQGAKVAIVFPDKVKGGFQTDSHRRVAIPLLIEECVRAGVEKRDIKLICSNGLHRKNTPDELKRILGDQIFAEYYWTHQIVNHDSEDPAGIVDLARDDMGNRVCMNRDVFESDVAILVGHVLGNPYGGYSGGYKHCATGLTNWESIASHHVPDVMHRDDFIPINSKSLMRRKFDAIGMHMEAKMEKKFFTCDAVLDTRARQIAVFSGYAHDVQPVAWQVANRRTYIP